MRAGLAFFLPANVNPASPFPTRPQRLQQDWTGRPGGQAASQSGRSWHGGHTDLCACLIRKVRSDRICALVLPDQWPAAASFAARWRVPHGHTATRPHGQSTKHRRTPVCLEHSGACQAKKSCVTGIGVWPVSRIILPASPPALGMQVWHLPPDPRLRPRLRHSRMWSRMEGGGQKGKIPPAPPALLLDETRCSWTLMSASGSNLQGLDCLIISLGIKLWMDPSFEHWLLIPLPKVSPKVSQGFPRFPSRFRARDLSLPRTRPLPCHHLSAPIWRSQITPSRSSSPLGPVWAVQSPSPVC